MSNLIEILWVMSLQSCVLILVVLLVRIVLRNYKKVYSYCLWFLVLARLLCPVFIESDWSLQPEVSIINEISEDVPMQSRPMQNENEGIKEPSEENIQVMPPVEDTNGTKLDTNESTKPVRYYLQGAYLIGATCFAIYFAIQYFAIKKKVAFAVRENDNIWLCEGIQSPFVMGVINPKIYLPLHIEEEEKRHILRHEQAHLLHKDPFVRMLGSIALILHWWNPLVWYAIRKMNQDMEMFCDETALTDATLAERKAYSQSLLQFAMKQSGLAVMVSFGESNTELRIKNVLKKKRTGIIIGVAVLVIAILCGIVFLTVPKNETENDNLLNTEEVELQQAEDEQEPKQTEENSKTLQGEFSIDTIYGDWLVYHQTDFGGISALSTEEQRDFNNIRLHYDEESCKYYDAFGEYQENVNIVQYTSEYMTKETFEEGFSACNFSALSWENDGVTYIESLFADDSNRFGSHIYVCEKDEILIYYEGVFFFAHRMSEKDIGYHEGFFYYEDTTNLSKAEVEGFANEVRNQVLEGDWAGISEKLVYPITIAGTTCRNAAEFLALNLDTRVSEDFLQKISEEDCENLFHNWQGIMMGETGQIWFTEVLNDALVSQGLKIIAINIPEKSTATYESEPWYKAYQTILDDWTSIDKYGDFSYLKGFFDEDYSFDNYYLCDVNSNGVPEFFLHSDYMCITAVFTYYDGQIRYLMQEVIDGINKETAEVIIYGHWHGAGGSGENEWRAYQITNNKAIESLYIDYFDAEGPYTIYTLDNPTYEKQETSEDYDELYAIHIQPALSWRTFEQYELEDNSGLNHIQ